jgi:hypothetical protein
MVADEDPQPELLRRFQSVINNAGLDDLRQMAAELSLLGAQPGRERTRPQRPELRRPPLPELVLFQVRVDLKHAHPPIWRRLKLRSDLTLDVLHRVLQVAFSWTDTHLWRFSLGGDPFDSASQVFLCQWDVDEGEFDDEGGVAAAEIRLDETIDAPGDVLSYVYDYGDNWELVLRLEEVRPATSDAPPALAIDGRRAAPPEDCGSLRTAEDLAEVLEDPSAFSLTEVNEALRDPSMHLTREGFDPRLAELVYRLAYTTVGEDVTAAAYALFGEPSVLEDAAVRESLKPFTWFVNRVGSDGLTLTAAGYLKPIDVEATAIHLPTMGNWIGKANRESETLPVLRFREALQSLGLVRKIKGTLRLTRVGAHAQEVRQELWNHLADRLVPTKEGFDTDATLLLLLFAATSFHCDLPLDTIAEALTELGWRTGAGNPIRDNQLYWLTAMDILRNTSEPGIGPNDRWRLSPSAKHLARAALRSRCPTR